MGHKRGHLSGKSMKNTFYILCYAKRHSWAEVTSNSEKIKLVTLVVIELHLSEGISQLLSQSVSQSVENSGK